MAFEAPRFWETDEGIYGGNAWTDRLNENVMYPSRGFHAERGVLVGAYVAGWTNQDNPDTFRRAADRRADQDQRGIDRGAAPGQVAAADKSPVAINWGQVALVRRSRRGRPRLRSGSSAGRAYAELLKPEGPIVFAGEHLSYVGLWQEGSALVGARGAARSSSSMAAGQKVG